jgi:hypothetical protein
MGSVVKLSETPSFEVHAVGAFVQKPGCPDSAKAALGEERLQRLCLGECYQPGDHRRKITRIEVVRIRRQQRDDEPIESLIDDPWKRIECAPSETGCSARFEDPEISRDTLYYVRAIQEPTDAVNAGSLRCERDAQGHCVKPNPCYGDYRTAFGDDCLAKNEERAWSSPIFVSFEKGAP